MQKVFQEQKEKERERMYEKDECERAREVEKNEKLFGKLLCNRSSLYGLTVTRRKNNDKEV
jgi:hypothetical protein